MKINGYNLSDEQEKELLQTFRNHPKLYMHNDIYKVQKFIDNNNHVTSESIDGTKIHFTEINITILIRNN